MHFPTMQGALEATLSAAMEKALTAAPQEVLLAVLREAFAELCHRRSSQCAVHCHSNFLIYPI